MNIEATWELYKDLLQIFEPPPDVKISEWADTYRMLSPESSAQPGRWSTDTTPYMREIMDSVCDPQYENVVIMSSSQVGKLLDVATPIATPNGWSTMGQLRVGDTVYGPDGNPTRVLAVTTPVDDNDQYEITFTDYSTIKAGAEHLWEVDVYKSRRYKGRKVLSTQDMLGDYCSVAPNGKRMFNFAIDCTEPVQYPHRILPVDPYFLGVWLADGKQCEPSVAFNGDDFESIIKWIPYTDRTVYVSPANGLNKYEVYFKGLKRILRDLGVLNAKHIPEMYKFSAVEQRLALLQGIMDGDGSVQVGGKCEIDCSTPQLAQDIYELICSLGLKTNMRQREAKRYGVRKKDRYRMVFTPYADLIQPFRLPRQVSRLVPLPKKLKANPEPLKRRIISIEPLKEKVKMVCIAVDNTSHLYLAGKTLIPTHNTEMILNIIGYYIHYDPAPMLIIQPNVDPMAKDFSTDRLAPMIRDTPVLFEKMGRGKSRTSDARMLHKAFPGGHLTIVGANSAAGLASRPIRIVLADEVDRYPLSAGNEGDPLGLALKRTTTFVGSRKHIVVSTPTEKGLSRIEAAYNEGTRERWCYSCPFCGKFQPLTWAQIRFEDVTHECQFCKERADELEWKSRPTMWLAEDPEATKARSFHINELSSPWKRWDEIIAEFRLAKAGGRDRLKVWVNTALGETFEEQGDTLDADTLLRRREAYNCELPDGVLVLTAAVDVQQNRLEAEVVGWGLGKESWGIQYKTFYGDPAVLESKDPTAPSVWEQLDKYLETVFFYEDGNGLRISCTCIDSGGHHTTEVYQFCVKREHRRIFAIRGQGTEGVPLITKPSRSNRWHCALFNIGVNAAKETLFSRIKTEFVGPNYCHFPIEPEKGYDEGYFRGLVAEKRMIRYFKGQPKVEWVKPSGARNEPLDLRNYATAALEILNPNLDALARIPREVVAKAQSNTGQPARRRRVLSSGVG